VHQTFSVGHCCPSQQTTLCLPTVRSAQLHLVFRTVYQLPFEQHPLPTLFDDTSRLIFSPATLPSTNCYHPRLRFELLFWHMARYKCRLLTYLLNTSLFFQGAANFIHVMSQKHQSGVTRKVPQWQWSLRRRRPAAAMQFCDTLQWIGLLFALDNAKQTYIPTSKSEIEDRSDIRCWWCTHFTSISFFTQSRGSICY